MTKEFKTIYISIPPAFQERVQEWIYHFTLNALSYWAEPKINRGFLILQASDLPNFISLNECGTELEKAWFRRSAVKVLTEEKQEFLVEVISDSHFGKFKNKKIPHSSYIASSESRTTYSENC